MSLNVQGNIQHWPWRFGILIWIYYLNMSHNRRKMLYFYRWLNICCHFFFLVNPNRNQILWILFIVEVSSSGEKFENSFCYTRATCLSHWICHQHHKLTKTLEDRENKKEEKGENRDWKEWKSVFLCLNRNCNLNLLLVEF